MDSRTRRGYKDGIHELLGDYFLALPAMMDVSIRKELCT